MQRLKQIRKDVPTISDLKNSSAWRVKEKRSNTRIDHEKMYVRLTPIVKQENVRDVKNIRYSMAIYIGRDVAQIANMQQGKWVNLLSHPNSETIYALSVGEKNDPSSYKIPANANSVNSMITISTQLPFKAIERETIEIDFDLTSDGLLMFDIAGAIQSKGF